MNEDEAAMIPQPRLCLRYRRSSPAWKTNNEDRSFGAIAALFGMDAVPQRSEPGKAVPSRTVRQLTRFIRR